MIGRLAFFSYGDRSARDQASGRGAGWTRRSEVPRVAAIDLATISDLSGLHAIETEWTALATRAGQPQQVFQGYGWLAAWAAVYLDKATRLSIVIGRANGRLVLVWPLVVRRLAGLRILTTMGEPLAQYSDALIASDVGEPALDAVARYIGQLPVDLVSLRRVRDDAAIATIVRRAFGEPHHRTTAPYVDFTGARDAAGFEKRFPGKVRSNRRRRRRRLEELGPLTFVEYGPSPEAVELVATAFAFKRDWAVRNGLLAPSLRDDRFATCFAAVAATTDPTMGLRVSALRSSGKVVGVGIAIACKGHLFGHVLAPCPDAAAFGVGGILAEHIILEALADGLARVDLLAPADPYKLEWTTTAVGVGDYSLVLTLRGTLYEHVWLRFGRERLKKVHDHLRKARLAKRRQPAAPRLADGEAA